MITAALLLYLAQPPAAAAEAYRHGVSLLEQKRSLEAAPEFERAVQLEPDNAQYWKALGVAYAAMNRLQDAAERFGRACTLKPDLPDACYYHGRVLYVLGSFEDALAPLTSALRADGVKGRADTAIAQCLEALGRTAEAESRYRWAVARHDAFEQQTRLAYARFLARQGRAVEAAAVLEAVQEPESAEFRYEFGAVLAQAGRLADAAASLERAVALKPSSARYRTLLAKVYRGLGRLEDAQREEQAIRESSVTEK